jgi:hypothetical protein
LDIIDPSETVNKINSTGRLHVPSATFTVRGEDEGDQGPTDNEPKQMGSTREGTHCATGLHLATSRAQSLS